MARIGTAYLEIDGDLSPLNRKLAQLRAKEGRIEVKVDIDRGSFASAAARKAALGGEEEVDLRANIDFSSFARARAAQAVLTKESAKLGDVFNRSQLSIGQWTIGLGAALPVILDVAGALGALTASLGAATVGLGAMATGAAAAATVGLGGIAAIAVPAISSLTDLMTAQEAADKARVTGSAAAARASVASAQQIQAAEQQLQSTQRSAEIAQESLTAAREEATRQLQDMRRAALGADESEESARIALRRAVLELQRVNGDLSSSTLDVRTAENDVALARNNLRDVTIDGSRAVKDYREAQRGGVKEMPQVVAAQRALDDANRDVAHAVQNLAYQQKQANEAAAAGGTTMAALALAQKKAGPAAVKFAGHIKDLGDRWRALTREGRNDFFGMLDDGVTRLNKKLPLLARSATKSMDALRGGFSAFLDKATGPEFDHFIEVMTNTFAKSIGPVARGFGNIAKVLQRIAVAIAPEITKWAEGFEDMTQGWVDSTRNAGKLRETLRGLVGHTEAWWHLLVAAKDLIIAALVPGMGEGKKAIEGMTEQLKEWTNWINAHPKETREFFKEALETTRQLAQALLSFIPTLFQISVAMRPLARAVLWILKGLNSLKIGNVSALTGLLGIFLGAKLIRGITGVVGVFTRLKTALFGVAAASKAASAISAVPLGVGTSTTTATGRTIGSTGTVAGGRFAGAFGAAATAGLVGAAAVGIYGAFTSKGGIIDTIKGKGTDAGAGMAEEMSSEFAAKVAPKMRHAMRQLHFGAMDQITEQTHGMIEAFDAAGIEVPEALRQMARAQDRQVANMKESFGDWKSSLTELKHMIFRSMGDIKDKTRETVRDINQIEGLGNDRRLEMTRKAYAAELSTIRKSLRLGLVSHKEADREINQITRRILKAYGVKDVQRLIVSDRVLAGAARRQRGGLIVPGTGTGDKVRGRLPVGSGVINQKAADVLLEPRELALHPEIVQKIGGPKVIDQINKAIPRFQRGGNVGGMGAMIAEANKFEKRQFPYVWGGGHGSFGIQPVDCSGAVSQILHAADLLSAPMVSGALASWGKPGKGPLTVYANPVHTLMSLGGRFFGTSSSNPGGGAGWIEGGFDQGYLSGLTARTMDVAAGGKIKLPRYKATALTATDEAASLNTIARAGEKAIKSAISAGGRFGGGQSLADFGKGPGKIVGASVYGFGEPGTGTVGASGVSLPGKPAFAELEMGNALGGLPFGKKLGIEVGGKKAVGIKLDIGAGGGAVDGHPRAIDFWRDLAQNLGVSGSFLGLAKVKGLQRGGVAPYLGAFHQGGPVLRDGFGLLKRGEEVISKQQGGIIGPTHWAWMMNEIRRLRTPHPLRERREQRREERREERRREREAERRRLARLQRETREETRARHRQEQRAERRQHERKERREARELERLLIEQTKELRQDIKEHNRLYRQVRGREKVALQGLASFVGSEIGAKGQEKRRLASAGSVARY